MKESIMAEIIVKHKINDVGDCSKCHCKSLVDSRTEDYEVFFCIAFDSDLYKSEHSNDGLESCQACKDFLTQKKCKVYCNGCNNLGAKYIDAKNIIPICHKNKNQFGKPFNWYSLNCKSKGTSMTATEILKHAKFITNTVKDWSISEESKDRISVFNEKTQEIQHFIASKHQTMELKFLYWLIATIRDISHEDGRSSIQRELRRLINGEHV